MADNIIHEANRNAKTARATQKTGRRTVERRPGNPRNGSASRRIAQLRCSLEGCLQKRWTRGINQQAAPFKALQTVRKAAAKTSKAPLKRSEGQRLQNRVVDAAAYRGIDSETLRHKLPHIACLANPPKAGLELPEAAETCQRTRRKGHRSVAKGQVAGYKKTREERLKPSFWWMKAVLCFSRLYAEAGHRGVRHRLCTAGTGGTDCRSSRQSVFRPDAINLVCILISRIRTFVSMILCVSSRGFLPIFRKALFWFWTAGWFIAGLQGVLRRDFPDVSRLSGCLHMRQSLILLSRSGITASMASLPITFQRMYVSLRGLYVLLLTICVHKNPCCVLSSKKPVLKYDSFHLL